MPSAGICREQREFSDRASDRKNDAYDKNKAIAFGVKKILWCVTQIVTRD